MKNIKIVTDSTVQLSKEEIETYNITVVPLSAMIDSVVYIDGETITKSEFLEKMNESPTLPKTSQPPIGRFVDTYNELGEDGSQVLSIHLTEHLSGTVQAAHQASYLSHTDVTVVDCQFIDRAMAFQVLAAAKLAQEGATMETILEKIEAIKHKTVLYICVVNLENLIKGGRISPTVGKISSFLNMKLLLRLTDTGLEPDTKGRGMRSIQKRMDKLIDEMKQTAGIKAIGITHIGLTPFTVSLIESLKLHFPDANYSINYASPSIMTHAGQDAFSIMYETV
ncbi:fatty acid-binding protein DegV [Carnobacterium divergens]|uniref:DegV family protein n=1 Tax=Carnobacterium divergens TaxID=2748 RepID=UPI001072BBEE|nr:DegV family protein [Carnobacterium divergens]TFJ40182.1 fatty acid-binding protein DegV [Carnobacterium divergens]TFJ48803.1 fatty acid-binding protein DegV [Carnobacterium divergens]TFJ54067.1 fatty acid-binding protein DegV [Carnobacterium divergens]TFJ59593.1 fatty acid-binding protein DegV [Carnobacterium divergens]TFJ70237.1 fatty acid-binding protein DegV [Carnobacterium divergens]